MYRVEIEREITLAFGSLREKEEGVPNRLYFNGKPMDETGLYYYGFRYYAPSLGRFMRPDPLLYMGGESYGYPGMNPVVLVDLLGMGRWIPEWVRVGDEYRLYFIWECDPVIVKVEEGVEGPVDPAEDIYFGEWGAWSEKAPRYGSEGMSSGSEPGVSGEPSGNTNLDLQLWQEAGDKAWSAKRAYEELQEGRPRYTDFQGWVGQVFELTGGHIWDLETGKEYFYFGIMAGGSWPPQAFIGGALHEGYTAQIKPGIAVVFQGTGGVSGQVGFSIYFKKDGFPIGISGFREQGVGFPVSGGGGLIIILPCR